MNAVKSVPVVEDAARMALWEKVLLGTAGRFLNAVRPSERHFADALYATERDMRAAGLIGPSRPPAFGGPLAGWPSPSVVLGGWSGGRPSELLQPLRCDGERHPHALILSPTGGGKTWNSFYPSLLTSWHHSVVAFDVKNELYLKTSGFRSTFSHVLRFAPGEIGSARYNPMAAVRPGPHAIGDVRNIVEHLAPDATDGKGGPRDPFFDEMGKGYLAGVILFVLHAAPPEERCLAGVASALARGKALGEAMQANQHPDPASRAFIRDAASRVWGNASERTVGSIVASADRYLLPYTEPVMADNTRVSDFTPSDLMCREWPVSLYLCSAKPDLERTKPLLRILISQIMAELQAHETSDRDGRAKRWRLLWALDELPVLGRLANLGTDLPVMRSHGMRALMGAQGLRQIWDVYGRDTAIINNARLICTRQNSLDEAREISGQIGEVLEERVSVSRSWGGKSPFANVSETTSAGWRVAMQPAEIVRLPMWRIIVMGEDRPILAYRSDPGTWQHLVREPAPSERLEGGP